MSLIGEVSRPETQDNYPYRIDFSGDEMSKLSLLFLTRIIHMREKGVSENSHTERMSHGIARWSGKNGLRIAHHNKSPLIYLLNSLGVDEDEVENITDPRIMAEKIHQQLAEIAFAHRADWRAPQP